MHTGHYRSESYPGFLAPDCCGQRSTSQLPAEDSSVNFEEWTRRACSLDEARQTLAATGPTGFNNVVMIRDRAMMLMYYHGLRIKGACTFTTDPIRFDANPLSIQLRLQAKGKKKREIPIRQARACG